MVLTVPFPSEGQVIMLGSTWVKTVGFSDVFSDDDLPRAPVPSEDAHPPSASPRLGFWDNKTGLAVVLTQNKQCPLLTCTTSTMPRCSRVFEWLPDPSLRGMQGCWMWSQEMSCPKILGPRSRNHFW